MTGSVNIFASSFRFPPVVCVLGTGPLGIPGYAAIPRDAHVIAVNLAIEIPHKWPNVRIGSWLVADANALKTPWFNRNSVPGAVGQAVTKIFSTAVLSGLDVPCDYHFSLVPQFEQGYRWAPERLRPDETVAGCAIDLACRFGAREVLLVGVDMCGETNFDGSPVVSNDSSLGERWGFASPLEGLIEWHQEAGFVIRSLTPTALAIAPPSTGGDHGAS